MHYVDHLLLLRKLNEGMVVLDFGLDLYLVELVIKFLEYFDFELNLEDFFERFLEDAEHPLSHVIIVKFCCLVSITHF